MLPWLMNLGWAASALGATPFVVGNELVYTVPAGGRLYTVPAGGRLYTVPAHDV